MPRGCRPGSTAPTLLGLAVFATLPAQSPRLTIPEASPFAVRFWDTASGLAQNSVNAVHQTRDGMLWVATFGGLARFDGLAWTSYDSATEPGFPDNRIMCLYEAADGSLWFGSALGVVTVLRDGVFTRVADVGGCIYALAHASDGRLYCASDTGLHVGFTDGSFGLVPGRPIGTVRRFLLLPAGELLAIGANGVHRLGDAGVTRLIEEGCTSATISTDGTVWVGTDKGLYRGSADGFEPASIDVGSGAPVSAVLAARDGALWFAANGSLVRVPEGDGPQTSFGLGMRVAVLAEDSAGGVWVGFNGGGLARVRESDVRLCAADEPGWLPCSVIDDRAGGWFVGTPRGLLHYHANKMSTVAVLRDRAVSGLFRDADGTLWVGLDDGVASLDGEILTEYRGAPGARVGVVRAIARDAKDRLVVGGDFGAFVLDGELRPYPAADAIGTPVKLVVRDAGGCLWLAGSKGLLRLCAEGELERCWTFGRDLPTVEVRGVLPRPNGCVWLATYGSGFVGIDGECLHQVGPNQGLLDAFVCTVAECGERWVIGSNRGAFLLDPTELDRIAEGARQQVAYRALVGPSDVGQEANGGVEPSSWSAHGLTAMCTIGGLAFVDTERLEPLPPPPACHVEFERSGDQVIERSAAGIVVRATVDRSFVVRCAAPEFDHPELLRYSWRLQPGGEWSQPMRSRTVSFGVPRTGDYVFEVVAVTVEDRVSPRAARVELHVAPLFWEHTGSIGFAITGILTIGIWGAFRFGRRRSARRAQELQALVDEQTAELRSAHETLEQRVAARTAELEEAMRTIEADHVERSALQREVSALQRMESLGQLAGSVAHDFNNLLTIVLGNAYLLEAEAAGREDLVEHAIRIREAGERGRAMTQHLLAVASRQTVSPSSIDLGRHLLAQRRMLGELLGPAVVLEMTVPRGEVYVQAAPGQLDQILMNLCINARDAMPDGGTVTVALERRGSEAALRVVDTGEGISEDVQSRLFEPFFTTRAEKGGTGLGLATVYGIIKQLKGEIRVESAPGEGACFTVLLPLTGAPNRPLDAETPPRPESKAESLRIMIVEDDAAVRRALRLMLESSVCRVVAEAENGADALAKLPALVGKIDVVLSDVRMPGIHGVDLIDAMHQLWPGLPVVFLSGYTSSSDGLAELRSLGVELVAKPPDRDSLLAVLRRAGRRGLD